MVNKKGFIRIVELAIAIMLISGIFLIVYRQNIIPQETQNLDEFARKVLSELGENATLRTEAITQQTQVAQMTKIDSFIRKRVPSYINYELRACDLSSACGMSTYKGNVFSAERIISADTLIFNPIKLRLFLWVNQ